MAVNKGNLARPDDRPTLAFKLESAVVETRDDELSTSRVVWDGAVEASARELWEDDRRGKPEPSARSNCKQAIKAAMSDGQGGWRNRLSTEIEQELLSAGFSDTTIKRAKRELSITSKQLTKGSADWSWVAPLTWNTPF